MRSKYKNKKTEYNGFMYHSAKEARYAQNLDILKKAQGKARVIDYSKQIPFQIILNNIKICKYILDFIVVYEDRVEHIDVKGYKTDLYKIKKKLTQAQYGIEIKEV